MSAVPARARRVAPDYKAQPGDICVFNLTQDGPVYIGTVLKTDRKGNTSMIERNDGTVFGAVGDDGWWFVQIATGIKESSRRDEALCLGPWKSFREAAVMLLEYRDDEYVREKRWRQ